MQIHPSDPRFAPGTFYLTAYGSVTCECSFSFKITAIAASIFIYNEEIICDVSEGQKLDHLKLNPNEYLYFKYIVPKIPDSYFIHVYATPGPDKIKLYASSHNLYPDENGYQWTSGSLKNYRSVPELFEKEGIPELQIFLLDYNNKLVHLPYLDSEKNDLDNKYDNNSVALKIDNESWRYVGEYCSVSCKNVGSFPISVSISIKRKYVLFFRL